MAVRVARMMTVREVRMMSTLTAVVVVVVAVGPLLPGMYYYPPQLGLLLARMLRQVLWRVCSRARVLTPSTPVPLKWYPAGFAVLLEHLLAALLRAAVWAFVVLHPSPSPPMTIDRNPTAYFLTRQFRLTMIRWTQMMQMMSTMKMRQRWRPSRRGRCEVRREV